VLSNGSVFTLRRVVERRSRQQERARSGERKLAQLTSVTASPVTGPDPQGVYRGDNHLCFFAVGKRPDLPRGRGAQMHWITTAGNGSITSAGNRGDDPYAIKRQRGALRRRHDPENGRRAGYQNATRLRRVRHQHQTAALWSPRSRRWPIDAPSATASLLPNGQVVIVGGQTFPVPFSDDTSIFVPEIWDPDGRVFRQLNVMQTPRNYHSTAILLPDGRVFVGGGGQCGTGCAANHLNAENLEPSLFVQPGWVDGISSEDHVGSFVRIAGGNDGRDHRFAGHVLRPDEALVGDPHRQQRSAAGAAGDSVDERLHVVHALVPSNPGIALPGYYMLFALNAQGAPSVAATVRIQ